MKTKAFAKDKILHLDSVFLKEDSAEGPVFISGYASTVDIDRANDVVPAHVWAKGIENYLKNPVILAQHDHSKPIGRMEEHRIDEKGLWIKARISPAAEHYFGLIKDGVVTAFSIGFRVLDAAYDHITDVFVVKELELTEISAVAVPCNPNTLFSLSKAFDSEQAYNDFKKQFTPESSSAKGLDSSTEVDSTNPKKEFNMNEDEIKAMVAAAAKQAAADALATKAKADAEAAAAAKAKADADAEIEARVKAAVAASVSSGQSGAEKLLAEVEKRINDATEASKNVLAGLEAELAQKASELKAIQESKMKFGQDGAGSTYTERETAFLLSKMSGKSIEATKYGRSVIEKAGPHQASQTWETEVSLNMENEVRRRLVVAPTLRQIQMATNVMTLPINPEAGYGTWVTNAQFGTSASAGAAQTHQLKELTINAYKLATSEYLAYEEEEDSLLVLTPIIRDAMIRRVAKSVDKAFLVGVGSGADPVKGLAMFDTVSAVTSPVANKATVANMIALRKDLGAWGLSPSELVYVVSTDVYYDLLEDTLFQTVDKIGDKATLLTGQIGAIGNTPVIVSAELPAKASGSTGAATNVGALVYHNGNFLVGNQRGMRFDTQDLVETQRKVMVASLRTGLQQVTTNLGGAVSAFRWVV